MRRTRSRGRSDRGAGRVADDPLASRVAQAAGREGSTAARGSRRPARRPSTHVPGTTEEPAPVVPAWSGLGSGEVRTDVPSLDDVLAGALPTGPGPEAAVAAPVAPPTAPGLLRTAGTRGRSVVGRLAGPLGRRVPGGVLTRRSTIVATAVVALGLGVGCGLGIDAVGGSGASVAEGPLPATPQACAVAQVAWSRAAAAQASMSQDEPKTLRDGYLRAQAVVDGVAPPPAVADDWDTYARYVETMAGAVSDVTKDAEITDAVATALAGIDTAEVMEASERITSYLQAGCATTP